MFVISEYISNFYQKHKKELEQYLDSIYTTKVPDDYPFEVKEPVNIKKECDKISQVIEFYETIESKGHKQGEIYNRYKDWLDKAVLAFNSLEKKEIQIKSENEDDIYNCELMLEELDKLIRS